jgi:hypothetical protein
MGMAYDDADPGTLGRARDQTLESFDAAGEFDRALHDRLSGRSPHGHDDERWYVESNRLATAECADEGEEITSTL